MTMYRGIFTVALAAALLLNGCSPYVNRIDHTYEPTAGSPQFAGGLGGAIDDVSRLQVQLYDKAGNQAKLQSGLVFSLIPLSAAAIYHGVRYTGEGTRGLVAKLGLTGAAIYGVGSLTHNNEREQLYLLGAQALGCAILSMRPFLLTNVEFLAVDAQLKVLDRGVNDLETAIETAKATHTDTEADIQAAQATLASAKKVLAEGNSLYAQVATAGMFLREHANDLVARVNVQIGRLQPDLTQIPRVAGSLMQISSALVPVSAATAPGTAKQATDGKAAQGALASLTAMSDLQQKAARAAAATISVATVVNRSAELAKTVQAISECKAPTAQGTLILSTDDRELNFTKKDETREFAIFKVQGMPRHALSGGYQGSLRPFSINVAFTEGIYRYTVTAVTEGPAEMQLVITDDGGVAKRAIALKQAKATPAGGGSAGQEHFLADDLKLGEAQIKTLQKIVGAKQTGTIDLATVGAVQAYAIDKKLGTEAPKQLTRKLYDNIVKKSSDNAARAAVEKFVADLALTKDQVKRLQKKVGVTPEDGIFGPKTMSGVKKYAKEHKLAASEPAQLDKKLYEDILKSNDAKTDAVKTHAATK